MRRVYLAARFERQAELKELARLMRAEGYTITGRWLEADGLALRRTPAGAYRCAAKDLDDVCLAEALVLFTDANPVSRGGSNVELGHALALGKRCARLLGGVDWGYEAPIVMTPIEPNQEKK